MPFDAEPEGWAECRLGEVAVLGGGTTPSKAEPLYWDNGMVPWATPTDITKLPAGVSRIGSTEMMVSELALQACSLPLNPPGTVLMTSRATIGFVAINDVAMTTNQGFITFRSNGRADPSFLLQWLVANRELLVSASGGSTFKELSRSTAKLLPISLPPIREQRRIADVLRSVDEVGKVNEEVCRATEKLLAAYLSASFAESLDDEAGRPIEELLTRIIDYRGVPPPKSADGIPLITAKNVRIGYLDQEPREFIAERDYDSWMRRGVPSPGDILFTTEAPLGFVAEFPSYKAALGQRTITLVANPARVERKYLKWLLLSPSVQKLIRRHATGSTAKGIKQSTFRKLRVNIPLLEEQRRIAAGCEDVWSALEMARVSGARHSATRSKVVADLLSGRVRVPA